MGDRTHTSLTSSCLIFRVTFVLHSDVLLHIMCVVTFKLLPVSSVTPTQNLGNAIAIVANKQTLLTSLHTSQL